MSNVVLGYSKRPELKEQNIKNNQNLEVKKGDILKVIQYDDATLNGEHVYDKIITYEVLGIRKGKDGRRVKVKDLEFGYTPTILIDKFFHKVEIIK